MENASSQFGAYVENTIRAKVPTLTLDDLFASQNAISDSVSETLTDKMSDYGYTIENTLITTIDPAKEVRDAMNRINASERIKEAAKNEAEADYIKRVREAEADRDRKRLQGEGMSQQRLAILMGYQSGIEHMAKRFGISPNKVLEFVIKCQYLDTIESIGKSSNTKTIFIPQDSNRFFDGITQAHEAK